MRRLFLLGTIVFFCISCNQDSPPKGVLDKEAMLNVMVDMQLTDAVLNLVYNSDTMKMQAKARYNYLFKKHDIDSATFSKSLRYYSKDPVELDSMYSLVSDSLTRLKEIVSPKPQIDLQSIRKAQAAEVYNYLFRSFKSHPSMVNKNQDPYIVDAKSLFKSYKNKLDSLKKQKDSVATDLKNKENTALKKVKNDLSTK